MRNDRKESEMEEEIELFMCQGRPKKSTLIRYMKSQKMEKAPDWIERKINEKS